MTDALSSTRNVEMSKCCVDIQHCQVLARLYKINTTVYGHQLSSLRKHAYSNILKISPPKTQRFQIKKSDIFFHISAQNTDCGYSLEPPRRGSSNEYPQFMFLSRNQKNNV